MPERTDLAAISLGYAAPSEEMRSRILVVRRLASLATFYGPAVALYHLVYRWPWIAQCRRSATPDGGVLDTLHCYWPTVYAVAVGAGLLLFAAAALMVWQRGSQSHRLFITAAWAVLILSAADGMESTAVSLAVDAKLVQVSFSGYWVGGPLGILSHGVVAIGAVTALPAAVILLSSRRAMAVDGDQFVDRTVVLTLGTISTCAAIGLLWEWDTFIGAWQLGDNQGVITYIWGTIGAIHDSGQYLIGFILATGAIMYPIWATGGRRVLIIGSWLACASGAAYGAWYICIGVFSYLGWVQSAIDPGDVGQMLRWMAGPPGSTLAEVALPVTAIFILRRKEPLGGTAHSNQSLEAG
jgi:hypothetical protein